MCVLVLEEMDPFNAMRENEKGLLKLMLLQPPVVPEDTCGEATIRIKLNMPNLASLGSAPCPSRGSSSFEGVHLRYLTLILKYAILKSRKRLWQGIACIADIGPTLTLQSLSPRKWRKAGEEIDVRMLNLEAKLHRKQKTIRNLNCIIMHNRIGLSMIICLFVK